MNPAKALQKLCQLKEAGQNVGGRAFVTRAMEIPYNGEVSAMEAAGKLCFKASAARSLSLADKTFLLNSLI